jgi:hypothetical protein
MSTPSEIDIFSLGQQALAATRAASEGRGFFVSARRLNADGTWAGPPEAACALVEQARLDAVGGLAGARLAGANTSLLNLDDDLFAAAESGMRCLVRLSYAADESPHALAQKMDQLRAAVRDLPAIDGIVPSPIGEAQGLSTLRVFSSCRLAAPSRHVIVDLDLLGHKLGQICLSFGADEILGTIVKQRGLRLGAAASSHDLTRDEAIALVRAAGLAPCERLPDGKVSVL